MADAEYIPVHDLLHGPLTHLLGNDGQRRDAARQDQGLSPDEIEHDEHDPENDQIEDTPDPDGSTNNNHADTSGQQKSRRKRGRRPRAPAPEQVPDSLICTACNEQLPKEEFIKNGRVLRTCRKHRSVTQESSWDEFVYTAQTSRAEQSLFMFTGNMPFDATEATSKLRGMDDTSARTRAVKDLLNDVHHVTGYRFAFRNTWKLGDTWVAKCACAQDQSWTTAQGFKPKAVAEMVPSQQFPCQSHLTLRLRFTERTFDMEVEHHLWHHAALSPPKTWPRLNKKPGKPLSQLPRPADIAAAQASYIKQRPTGLSRSSTIAHPPSVMQLGSGSSVANPAPEPAASGLVPSSAKRPRTAQPAMTRRTTTFAYPTRPTPASSTGNPRMSLPPGRLFPVEVASTPNSDSYNHCRNVLRRAESILDEFRTYMCEDDNFAQFRQFFYGIETFVNAYDSERGGH